MSHSLYLFVYLIGTTLLCNLNFVNGYGRGAPDTQCDTMVPKHGPSQQRTPCPYQVLLSDDSVKGGEQIKVRLASPNIPFKGFLAMGSKIGSQKDQFTIGRIEISDNSQPVKYVTCFKSPNTAVTHTNNSPKKNIEFDWIAPNEGGTYVILATFVKDKDTFWVNVTSPPITVQKNPNFFPHEGDDERDHSNEEGGHDIYKPIINELRTKYYDGCGKTKGCFGFPVNCLRDGGGNCDMFSSWRYDSKSRNFRFQIAGKLPGWNTYEESQQIREGHISSGLSFDKEMGQDSVIGCVLKNGRVKPKSYFNLPPNVEQNSLMKDENAGLVSAESSGKYQDGYLFCEFTRTPILPDVSNELKRTFDLEKDTYYIMMARANEMSKDAENGREKLGYHVDLNKDKCVSYESGNLKKGYNIELEGENGTPSKPTKIPSKEETSKSSATSLKGLGMYWIVFILFQFLIKFK